DDGDGLARFGFKTHVGKRGFAVAVFEADPVELDTAKALGLSGSRPFRERTRRSIGAPGVTELVDAPLAPAFSLVHVAYRQRVAGRRGEGRSLGRGAVVRTRQPRSG